MEEESNKINWSSGSDNSPYVSKKYRKSTVVIVFWVIIFVFFGLVLLTGLSDKSTYSDDAGIATIWFLTILEIIFLFKIFGAYLTTLTVGAESLIYKKGVLFRRKSEISYIQISSVESSSFLGMGNIEVILLNNDYFKFEHVQNFEVAETLINERIKENRLKVQVMQVLPPSQQ